MEELHTMTSAANCKGKLWAHPKLQPQDAPDQSQLVLGFRQSSRCGSFRKPLTMSLEQKHRIA